MEFDDLLPQRLFKKPTGDLRETSRHNDKHGFEVIEYEHSDGSRYRWSADNGGQWFGFRVAQQQ
jgi:hypothetical protein